jgi:two-component system sensor histidine kinase DesK
VVNLARWERIGRWFMSAWVLLVVPSAVSVVQSGHGPVQLSILAGFTVWAIVWLWLWFRVVGRSDGGPYVALTALTVLLSLFTLIAPSVDNSFLVFSFIVAGVCLPLRRAVWAVIALAILQLGLAVIRLTPPPIIVNLLINSILVGGLGMGARIFWQSYSQLLTAREQLAHLAVTEERLRFARDLHDLLGQSLSVLVLKSEVVAKQLPEDADDSLRNEVRDIANVARKSLNDVREAVAGYRRPTLQAEISSARRALRAAGIGLLVEESVGPLPPEQDGVLAWCLREAVTNVVRHSQAKKCEVRIVRDNGEAMLEVSDDGRGATSLGGGNGLAGMRERVALVGGTMKVASDNGSGLHVQVSVPQPA